MLYPNLNRRQLLILGAAALHAGAFALPRQPGRLVVVGGAEDRLKDKVILRRFLDLSGGVDANILILTAASADQSATWLGYEQVFREMGGTNTSQLAIHNADEANAPETANRILNADGIFMTGGDQRRLMERLWETGAARAMHTAFHVRRCCIGGTSAGAAASHIQFRLHCKPPVPVQNCTWTLNRHRERSAAIQGAWIAALRSQ